MAGKKVLMVIAQENFRDEEFFEPKKVFENNGVDVTVASTDTKTATGMLGGTAKPDIKISDADMDDYDAIVISGGSGSKEYLWDNEQLHELVNKAYKDDKIVSAICVSPVVLAKSGILEGKNVTVFDDPNSINEVKECGACYENEGVVNCENIITGKGPDYAEQFGEAVLDALS
ncbi:intracellular protease, PfpI family [Methanohalobium evestigatum Z-7303]|uniref:Intracellular protease, PfpI family n=1 Tax=Methanohalobium evestigatum (strain ATCC BAA-1072 / DSM 3721 / NBRC 107634 / OCM 161 / Z-7303) TaxID=644295 RepID=D7E7I4_METEZ|nr:DJ-1/PfpI family protein [Methanohalobium evestigatum]ADI73933.1 intracellular protease, PfpI family [Methanohalobium evestigatum Z-7303]